MKRLVLLLLLCLPACATTETAHNQGRHRSERSNHQHDHEQGEKDRDRWMWQQPRKVMKTINVTPGMTIADVGAGDGYFTFRLAERVGTPGGATWDTGERFAAAAGTPVALRAPSVPAALTC